MAESEARAGAPVPPHPVRKGIGWWLRALFVPGLTLVAGLLVIVALGFAQRAGWLSADGSTHGQEAGPDQVFTCAMHPQIRQKRAGRCPICGMALVPATRGGDFDELGVEIEPAQRRLANIQTAEVKAAPVTATIRTVGAIAIDESRMATIAAYVDGRLERLFADYTGVDVAKGNHLAILYSPELYRAQVEYVENRKLLAKMSAGGLAVIRETQQDRVASTRRKLVELGLNKEQLAELEASGEAKLRQTIYAPMGGTVIEKLAVEGKYIKAGEPIYRIADLSTVWLMLELYPEDASQIRFGQRVNAQIQSLPGELFQGRVAFLDRTVDPRKRTVGVRVEFLNLDGKLRPGDYANATIYLPIGQLGEVYDSELAGRWISPMHPQIISDKPGVCTICGMDLVPTSRFGYSKTPVDEPNSLFVPRSALLLAGNNSVVYVETKPGRFEIRPVVLGPILKDRVIILSGLRAGEQVATAGNFLIDSQMQLAGKPSLIDPTRAITLQVGKSKLEFDVIRVRLVPGNAGARLESLFAAYFQIHRSLAADQKPDEGVAVRLHRLASELANEKSIASEPQSLLKQIARDSVHLHDLDLRRARSDAFQPISRAVVKLASLARGDAATQPFHHMFCHMVEGGGDWLQPNEELANPYWGSQMLTCGRTLNRFPARGESGERKEAPKNIQRPPSKIQSKGDENRDGGRKP